MIDLSAIGVTVKRANHKWANPILQYQYIRFKDKEDDGRHLFCNLLLKLFCFHILDVTHE